MDLTSLVVELRRLTPTASNGAAGAPTRAEAVFAKALKAVWSGKHRQAVELVSGLLAEEPDTTLRFAAYRLWVEGLAELKERTSLALLSEHLFLRGQAEPDDHATYLALRGLIDLELDQVQSARLTARALRDYTHDPYALEMVQIIDNRTFDEDQSGEAPLLLTCTTAITDYFHWLTIARGLLLHKDRTAAREALDEVFDHVREAFRGCPLPSLFSYHRYVESRDYAAAAFMAGELARIYPECVDYLYYQAYALFEDGDYPEARRVLNQTLSLSGERDPEVLSLLGHCNAKLGDAERARHYLDRASVLLQMEGLPSTHMRLELDEVDADLRKGAPDPRRADAPAAYWLVELSPRRYHEMLTSTDESLSRLLRPLGIGAKPGDVAYFGTRVTLPTGERQWKLIADYTVESEPMWHPTARYHSALKLDSRYEVGVPVPGLEAMAEGTTRQERSFQAMHAAIGVFELDERGVGKIVDSLRDHFADHFTERRIDGGRTRTDVG